MHPQQERDQRSFRSGVACLREIGFDQIFKKIQGCSLKEIIVSLKIIYYYYALTLRRT